MQRIGKDCFGGSFEDWGSLWTMQEQMAKTVEGSRGDVWSPCEAECPQDVSAGFALEKINIVKLTEAYEDRGGNDNDDLSEVRRLLLRHREECVSVGDFSTVRIPYIKKYGIPGRRLAVGASMQRCPRWARDIAFSVDVFDSQGSDEICIEIDQNCSLPNTLKNEVIEYVGEDDAQDVHMIKLFPEHYRQWRRFLMECCDISEDEAKQALLPIYFLGKPKYDFPFLWQLALHVHGALRMLLGSPKYEYLLPLFADRRSPLATRAHYALASVEDTVLSALEFSLTQRIVSLEVMTYLFDGIVIRLKAAEAHAVREAIDEVGLHHNTSHKVKKF